MSYMMNAWLLQKACLGLVRKWFFVFISSMDGKTHCGWPSCLDYVFWCDQMTTYIQISLLSTSLLLESTQWSAICRSSFWANITVLNSLTFVSPALLLCLLSSFFIPRRALQHPKSTIHKSCNDDAFPVTYWSGTPEARQFGCTQHHFPVMLWRKMQKEGREWLSTEEAAEQTFILLLICSTLL